MEREGGMGGGPRYLEHTSLYTVFALKHCRCYMQTVNHVNVSAFDDNSHENEHSYNENYRDILRGVGGEN